jgi:hypothetical protein
MHVHFVAHIICLKACLSLSLTLTHFSFLSISCPLSSYNTTFSKKEKQQDDTTIMMEKANQSYREKQYEQQHHHPTDKTTPRSAASSVSSSSNYLDTLSHHSSSSSSSSSSWDNYKTTLYSIVQNQANADETTSDKLQIMKNLLTWEDYKQLVSELQLKKEECSKLQGEVRSLKRLLQVERSVRHHYPTQVEGGGGGGDEEKELELKTLEDKANEYDEAIKESKVNEDSVRWH